MFTKGKWKRPEIDIEQEFLQSENFPRVNLRKLKPHTHAVAYPNVASYPCCRIPKCSLIPMLSHTHIEPISLSDNNLCHTNTNLLQVRLELKTFK